MGRQYNKVEKRKRRKAYNNRLKDAINTKAKTKAKAKAAAKA